MVLSEGFELGLAFISTSLPAVFGLRPSGTTTPPATKAAVRRATTRRCSLAASRRCAPVSCGGCSGAGRGRRVTSAGVAKARNQSVIARARPRPALLSFPSGLPWRPMQSRKISTAFIPPSVAVPAAEPTRKLLIELMLLPSLRFLPPLFTRAALFSTSAPSPAHRDAQALSSTGRRAAARAARNI